MQKYEMIEINPNEIHLKQYDNGWYKHAQYYRIRALIDFDDVKKGDWGGYISKRSNLSQEGNCWIYDDAIVCGHSSISQNAKIRKNAIIVDAQVSGNAVVTDNAFIDGRVRISDKVCIKNNSHLNFTNTYSSKRSRIFGNTVFEMKDDKTIWFSNVARISSNKDFCFINNFKNCLPYDATVFFYRALNDKIMMQYNVGHSEYEHNLPILPENVDEMYDYFIEMYSQSDGDDEDFEIENKDYIADRNNLLELAKSIERKMNGN